MTLDRLKLALNQLYSSALEAVDPEKAVANFLRRDRDKLWLDDRSYDLNELRKIFLVGTGKAGVPMARAVEQILGDRLEGGIVVVKDGHGGGLEKTQVLETNHPEPDERGVRAAGQILDFLEKNLCPQDLLFVVLSGGGSALLPAPVEGISLADKQKTTAVLLKCGATIQEINTIRKHLSRIKGGRLVEHTRGAQVAAMMLSDVVGDDLASIASGPTVPDPSTFTDSLEIIRRYEIEDQLTEAVVHYLRSGVNGERAETPKPGDPRLALIQNTVVASNILALQAAAAQARSLGFTPLILSSSVSGNTADIASLHVAIAREVLLSGNPTPLPCCIISGGETTVRVVGNGKGGRSQEFALWCAREIADWKDAPVLFASLGSDGNDGPTDAAGALSSPQTAERAKTKGLSLPDYLARNDSYHFFEKLGDLILTGPTQTNVMDFRFVLIGTP